MIGNLIEHEKKMNKCCGNCYCDKSENHHKSNKSKNGINSNKIKQHIDLDIWTNPTAFGYDWPWKIKDTESNPEMKKEKVIGWLLVIYCALAIIFVAFSMYIFPIEDEVYKQTLCSIDCGLCISVFLISLVFI